MTAEQRWIRTQRANAKRGLQLKTKLEAALGSESVRKSREELATIENILAVVDVYAAAGGFRREPKAVKR
jgi:hypothetical protein